MNTRKLSSRRNCGSDDLGSPAGDLGIGLLGEEGERIVDAVVETGRVGVGSGTVVGLGMDADAAVVAADSGTAVAAVAAVAAGAAVGIGSLVAGCEATGRVR